MKRTGVSFECPFRCAAKTPSAIQKQDKAFRHLLLVWQIVPSSSSTMPTGVLHDPSELPWVQGWEIPEQCALLRAHPQCRAIQQYERSRRINWASASNVLASTAVPN